MQVASKEGKIASTNTTRTRMQFLLLQHRQHDEMLCAQSRVDVDDDGWKVGEEKRVKLKVLFCLHWVERIKHIFIYKSSLSKEPSNLPSLMLWSKTLKTICKHMSRKLWLLNLKHFCVHFALASECACKKRNEFFHQFAIASTTSINIWKQEWASEREREACEQVYAPGI